MSITAEDLEVMESSVAAAFQSRDHSHLNIIGFGEITVALGFPAADPTHVCKRSPTMSNHQFDAYKGLVNSYTSGLAERGVGVVETEVWGIERGANTVAYIVQPLLDSATLGHNVLKASEPDPEHPFLVELGAIINTVDDRLSIDAQVTNWSVEDSGITLIDVGTPFMWDAVGRFEMDMAPSLAMLPAPVRSFVRRDLTKVVTRWRSPRGVAADVVANLYREGLDDWVMPAAHALGGAIDEGDPVDIDSARRLYSEDLKTWPRLAKLKKVQRAWRTQIRRKQYEFFVQSTYEPISDVGVAGPGDQSVG